jgi:hypothetical protein
MAEETLRLGDAGEKIAVDVASGAHETQQARLAAEMAKLDQALAVGGAPTTTQLYRRYHNYEAWRAQALLEGARRYAVLARRAIEARYVVDLSSLQRDELRISPIVITRIAAS